MKRRAEISRDGLYRYLLERHWTQLPLIHQDTKILVACMLNPSKADATEDDPTIRWLVGWAKKRDYTGLRVVNLAAYRSTSPERMMEAADPHGVENFSWLAQCCQGDTLCAWGALGKELPRYDEMLKHIHGRKLCLTTTKDGSPAHPLRKSHSLELKPWSPQ